MRSKTQLFAALGRPGRVRSGLTTPSHDAFTIRTLSTHETILPPAQPPPPPPPSTLDPRSVVLPRDERRLLRSRVFPVGSRRRRAALLTSKNIPFEQLPYQCFQEARKVLQEDRAEKIEQIEVQRARIERLKEQDASVSGGEMQKQTRLASMRRHLESLKVLADINDPLVKKRFEDGRGDMNRPIYRYLEEQKWRARRRLITTQRITQMNVVPDVLPSIDITADVELFFHGVKYQSKLIAPRESTVGHRIPVQPGEFVASKVSEHAPRLEVQVFDKGERLVTVAVIDSDVPDVGQDSFNYRCHMLAANIPISPTSTTIRLAQLNSKEQVLLPWTAPYAQKGSPYHRISVLVLQQPEGKKIDVAQAKEKVAREGFVMRAFADRYSLHTIGAHLFRTQWDEYMDDMMRRAGYEGAGVELKRRRVVSLPSRYKKSDGAKYRGG